MIVYHPLHDLYHCIYRITGLIQFLPDKEFSDIRLKIYDYYLLFPHELKKITLPRHLQKYKRLGENKYYYPEVNKSVFFELNGIQDEALRLIGTYGIIDLKLFINKDIIKKKEKETLFAIDEEQNPVLVLFLEYFEKLSDEELVKKIKV